MNTPRSIVLNVNEFSTALATIDAIALLASLRVPEIDSVARDPDDDDDDDEGEEEEDDDDEEPLVLSVAEPTDSVAVPPSTFCCS